LLFVLLDGGDYRKICDHGPSFALGVPFLKISENAVNF
jgi:hypothetical protein